MSQYNHDIIYKATPEQLREVVEDWLHRVKRVDPDMHEELECDLYEKVNGPHFDRYQYDKAMMRRGYYNGSRNPKWTVEQINEYARRQGDRLDRYNEYDLAYEMNTLYDDYYGTLGESADTYYKMSRQKLDNRDGQEGRAWRDNLADNYNRRTRDRYGRYAEARYDGYADGPYGDGRGGGGDARR